ncbi:unnamed protein product [Heligmosomoides polygyrus]|uniref:CXXC-type domain-containing protein n=1 Tax=Heligmosomoides polygyrus TaxID=6339 RepID=A0A183FUA6_HELPZ|nr:unnamed protein product [Heligmosomoides polygyrus]
MTAVEAGTPPSADVLVEEPAADDEVVLPDGEEPTEEQVANAMRLSGSAEASPDESTGSEESKSGQTSCAISSDIQDDFKCPTCGSTDDPSFMHCKKILKQTGTNFGAFVWRYRCARQACAKFFGDYYAYDKVSNSFVRLPEDADMVEQGKNEEEQRPEVPAVEDEDDDSDSAHSPPVAENIEPTAAEDTKAEDEPPSKEEPVEKTPHRSGRRARQTIRKSTAVVAKVKTPLSAEKKNQTPASLEKKKPEKTPISKVPKEAKSRVTPKRQPKKPVEAEKASSAPPAKKLPKGYVYEPVLDPQQQQQKVTEMIQKASIANGSMVPSSSECSTQTMCPAHVFSTLIDQLVNTQAESSVGSSLTTESPSTLPAHVARRLMISQQLIQRQSNELCRVQEENKRLYNIVALMNSVIRKFGDEYTPELRHLRDAIVVLKREFSFYQDEFVAEAKKSVVNIQARIDLHIKEREAADERADGFLRKISERDRDVILANKARDRAERKLKDSLYVANNAKCAHCQISDRMRAHLTDVVAEKTVLLEKSQKECQDLSRRADQSERISRILSKESEKLKFDLNTWKSDAERNLAEIARLKEELKRASAGHPMLNATTAMLQKPKADSQSPRQAASHSNSPAVPSSNEKPGTPRDSDPKGATTAQDERSNSTEAEVKPTSSGNRTSQGNPAARTPPEDPASPFSSWLGKVGPLYPLFSALNSSSNLMAAEDQIF